MTIAVRPDWNGNEAVRTFDDAEAALAYMRDHPSYEIVPDGKIRLYGDIDYKVGAEVDTEEKFNALDRQIFEALTTQLADEFPIAVFSASSWSARKLSARWVIPSGYVTSREHAKYFAKEFYSRISLPEGAVGDLSVYSFRRKMRTLWTSKPNENRPFRMVQGKDIDHLISYIPEGARHFDFPLPEKEKAEKGAEGAPKPTFTKPDESLLTALCDCVSTEAWTGYKSCEGLIFTLLALGAAGNFIHFYCAKAPNYGFDWVNGYITRYDPAKNRHSIGTLRYYAKQGNPEAYAALAKDPRMGRYAVDESVRLTTDAASLTNWCDEKGFLRALPVVPTLGVKSHLGTGKTTRCIEACTPSPWNPRADRIVVISCRQSFTTHICAELEGFTDYRNAKAGMLTEDRVVVQLQSLWRCGEMSPRDLILLDESESILASLTPNQTHKHYVETYRALERLVRQAGRVIALDAFLTDRTMEFLRTLRGETTLCINPTQPYKKTAQLVSERDLYQSIRDTLAEGKRMFAVWGAVKPAVAFHQGVQSPNVLYHSMSDPAIKKQHLSAVNRYWAEYPLVGYTSTITVGINYNGTPFDKGAVYATGWTCPARDYAQALHRARKLTDNHLVVHISGRPRPCSMEAGLDEQEREMTERSSRIREFLADINARVDDFTDAPAWLLRILAWNFNEIVVSRRYFPECMKHFFRECGISYGEDAELERPERGEKGVCIQVVDVADIDYDTAQRYARARETLSDTQRYELEKYFMTQKVDRVDQFIWEEWLRDERKIKRAYALQNEAPADLIRDKVIQMVPKDAERLHAVQTLGWDWSSKWQREIGEIPPINLDLFGVRQRSDKDTPEQRARELCKALKQWCGLELKVERTRVRRGNAREYRYMLTFDPAGQVIDYIPKRASAQEVFSTE